MKKTDFLVIGGGIIGISVAHELRRRHRDSRVTVIEKEKACGLHASGRNSGVLHAGFYYTADSLKAKFTQTGNRILTRYCEEKKLPINKCGKLVVAKDKSELSQLDELLKRGRRNGVPLEMISEKAAKKIEPRVKTYQRALFSPTTSSVDPIKLVKSLKKDAVRDGVRFDEGVSFLRKTNGKVETSGGEYAAGYVVNCAGLYADHIAKAFGFSKKYRILPFKGLYLYSPEPAGSLKTNIYPVPDLKNPFLGVHFTVTVDGRVKIGPTATPAFWREQYNGWTNFRLNEFADVLLRECGLMMSSGFDFMKLAVSELRKCSRPRMVELASELVTKIEAPEGFEWGKPGIRAQLMHAKEKKLVMDFILEGDKKSFHVLNAVSPGLTCAVPFSSFVCDKISGLLK